MNMTRRRAATEGNNTRPRFILVWDPFVRMFHWSLVAVVLTALATELLLPPTWIGAHVAAGTMAVALVTARIIWGFLGPASARFSSFVHRPRVVLGYAAQIGRGTAPHHLGHNPLGGTMILVLMAAVAALGVTGTVALGGTLKAGPLAFMTSFASGEVFRDIHEMIAYGLISLLLIHIAGAVFESRRGRENLVWALIDGRKRRRSNAIGAGDHLARPLLAAAIAVVLIAAGGAALTALAARPALGVPSAPLDPGYAEECGACHVPFHPSLAPAATWSAVMATLGEHFGEDASLEPLEVEKIRRYLVSNAAETADTKPANRLRRTDRADPLRITATPFWRRAHRSVPDSAFAAPTVRARSNCNACHRDAETGRFDPRAIDIPDGDRR